MAPQSEDITLFYWGLSAWAAKVTAYMALRKMPHSGCDQPITMPRPDYKALGVNYRRIPILAIGRDIYCDTLVILQKLDDLFPESTQYPSISGQDPISRTLDKLFEKWTDAVVFKYAADAIPTSVPLCQDPQFIKDRTELWGYDWAVSEQDRKRPRGQANLRANIDVLEDLLADGRKFLLGTDSPKLADIHAGWIFSWMRMLGGLPDEYFRKDYPKTHAWLDRYDEAIKQAKEDAPKETMLPSEEAIDRVLSSKTFLVPEKDVNESDPLGLKKGQLVEVYAEDTGFNHRDTGKLVSLDNFEVVIEKPCGKDGSDVRLHFPRWNFSIKPSTATA